MSDFRKELEQLINKFSKENGSDTPDFVLAEYLEDCLNAYDKAVNTRNEWVLPDWPDDKDDSCPDCGSDEHSKHSLSYNGPPNQSGI